MDVDLATWSLLVGSLLPPVVAILQQPRFPDWVRAVLTLVVCLVVGAGTAAFAGDLNGQTWVTSALTVFVAALAVYRNFWKQLGVTQRIETATSPSGQAA